MNGKNVLYIVATPIGNLEDITLRAVNILKNVDLIVCEDTRVSSKLLAKYDIKKPLISLNEFNEDQVIFNIIHEVENRSVALISDAGTPLISDPGYKLVNLAKKKGVSVIPVPGPNAAIAALSASGLPTDKFSFLGFLPKSSIKSQKVLEQYKIIQTTIVLYESPHRVVKTLESINNVFGDIPVVVARELTKIHEEIVQKKVSEWIEGYKKTPPKGEFVLIFSTKKTSNF